MIRLKNRDEIERIRASCRLLAETFRQMKKIVAAGITTRELDQFAQGFIEKNGGKPASLGYLGYPASISTSINEEVIHGIPQKRKLKDGDIVDIDLGVNLNGYYSDMAVTFEVGEISESRIRLLEVTRKCLELGIRQAVAGKRLSDISSAVYSHATKNGYGIVRQYCGHGIGFDYHEDPQIPNYVSSGPNLRLKAGMVLAIEPMINQGTWEVKVLKDKWTVVTADGQDSAHFEHTVAIFEDHTEILTNLE